VVSLPAGSSSVRLKVCLPYLLRSDLTQIPLGGLFPGITLYLSSFYKRHEMQLRFSLMFSVASLAGAFSGLLAAAIENMNGQRGLAGWAWIFVLVRCYVSMYRGPCRP
jgi:MFS family permease